MSLFSENGIYYTIVTIAIVLIANTLGDKIKNAINPNNEDILKPNPFLADETKTNEYISVCETDSHESTGYSSIIHFNDINNKSRLALVYDFGHALGKFHLQGTENTTNLRLIELN